MLADVGGDVGVSGQFGIAGNVDAAERDLAVVRVTEALAFYSEAVGGGSHVGKLDRVWARDYDVWSVGC